MERKRDRQMDEQIPAIADANQAAEAKEHFKPIRTPSALFSAGFLEGNCIRQGEREHNFHDQW